MSKSQMSDRVFVVMDCIRECIDRVKDLKDLVDLIGEIIKYTEESPVGIGIFDAGMQMVSEEYRKLYGDLYMSFLKMVKRIAKCGE